MSGMRYEESMVEGRNPVIEAFRSGKTVDKLFILDGCQDGPVKTILEKQKNRIPGCILYQRNGWISFRRQNITRA